jgi:hypothetical protein
VEPTTEPGVEPTTEPPTEPTTEPPTGYTANIEIWGDMTPATILDRGVDIYKQQPPETIRGGIDREAPPVPYYESANVLIPMIDGDDVYFLEFDFMEFDFDDIGVPLGEWRYNNSDGEWEFDFFDDDVPLSAFPWGNEESIEQTPMLGEDESDFEDIENPYSTLPQTSINDNTAQLLLILGISLGREKTPQATMAELIKKNR